MSLRIIFGRAGSGKTRYCMEEIKGTLDKQGMSDRAADKIVLLVPEQFTFQAERDLIRILEKGGIINSEVLSFRRMAFRIFNQAGGIAYQNVNNAGKCMLIYSILDESGDSLKIFAKAADHKGYVNTLTGLFTEFKRYEVTPGMMKEFLVRCPEGPLKEKLAEINLIYDLYEKELGKRYRDSDDDLTIAARKLAKSGLYDGARIYIDGFTGFTPQEYSIIGELIERADSVTVTLCSDSLDMDNPDLSADLFASGKRMAARLLKMARERGVEVEGSVHMEGRPLPRFRDNGELAHLEANFGAYVPSIFEEPTKNLSIFSSMNVITEVEAAARDILKRCREDGLRFGEIAVVVGNLGEYSGLISTVFGEYEIPCFLDEKVEISNHPSVRMILSLMEIFIEGWTYETVFRYLKTGLTDIPGDELDRLENYVLACGIRGSRWTADRDWDMAPGIMPDDRDFEKQSSELKSLNLLRRRITEPLKEFRAAAREDRSARGICTALYALLCRLEVPGRIENLVEGFKKDGELGLAEEYSQVWNIILSVFDQVVEIMGDKALSLERFSRILQIGFGQYRIGLIPASIDQVLVGNVERSKSHQIKALYILGANDGQFPAEPGEEGLLSDEDRVFLDKAGIELAPDTRTKAFDEQFLAYRALTASGGSLRISWPIADNEGKTMRPSSVISRLRKIFPKIMESSNLSVRLGHDAALEKVSAKSPTFREMIGAVRELSAGRSIDESWGSVYRWYDSQLEWREKCRVARNAFQYRNEARPVSRTLVRKLYGDPVYSSVSRLEKYNACPFSYYVRYGLGAKERKIFKLSPPDVGTFLHAVIERFSKLVSAREPQAADGLDSTMTWRSLDYDSCHAGVSAIVDDMLLKMKGSGVSGSKRYALLTARLKRVVTRAVWLISRHIRSGSFDPIGYELDFGKEGAFPPIVIELESGDQVLLTGRIDRIDTARTDDGTYLRIIDYKSGNKDFKLSDIYYGLSLQLITYLDAIWENGGMMLERPLLPAGMLYFKVDDPLIRIKSKQEEGKLEEQIMKALKMKGLVLADVKIVKAMDMNASASSLIIPAKLKAGDEIGGSVATLQQFNILRTYARRLLKSICEDMMKGAVPIKPYKTKDTSSCTYCSYSSICGFDSSFRENAHRFLYNHKNDELWKKMEVISGE